MAPRSDPAAGGHLYKLWNYEECMRKLKYRQDDIKIEYLDIWQYEVGTPFS